MFLRQQLHDLFYLQLSADVVLKLFADVHIVVSEDLQNLLTKNIKKKVMVVREIQ